MKKVFGVCLMLLTLSVLLICTAVADDEPVIQEGVYENISWTLNMTTGELVISGEGNMPSLVDTPAWLTYARSIQSVVIEEGITSIGLHSFKNCTNLTEVTIPEGVTAIQYLAFWYCTSLKEITIPNSCIDVNKDAFSGCEAIATITAPANAIPALPQYGIKSLTITNGTSIPNSAFFDRSSLLSITLPDTITSIGAYAFYNCKGLTELVLPDGVTSIGYSAFQGCDSLERINIPMGVTTLEVDTFSGCKSLKSIELPEGMTVVKRGVFNNCQSLASVVIPQTVEIIESRAFYGCRSLTEVVIPDSVTEISDFAFADCEGLQRLVIPKGIQSISGYAFDCTYHIQHAVMPTYAITYIPRSELKTVVFTAGDWIKEDALKDCSALEKIVFCGTETEWKTLQTKAAWKNGPAKLATYHDCTWTATESRHTGECAMCGAKIDAAHSWDAGTVIQAATHLETGKKKQTCDACKESREVVLEKLTAHTYGNATDLGESQHKQVCSCGEEKLSSHAYGSWKVVEKATEAAEGRYERSCACGRIETKAIPRLDHDYETHVITPTCTEPGYHEYVCKNCSESYCDSFVEALGHRYLSDADTVCAECGALREIVTDAPPAEVQSGCGAWVSGWGVMLLALAAGCGACLKRKGQPKKKTCNV